MQKRQKFTVFGDFSINFLVTLFKFVHSVDFDIVYKLNIDLLRYDSPKLIPSRGQKRKKPKTKWSPICTIKFKNLEKIENLEKMTKSQLSPAPSMNQNRNKPRVRGPPLCVSQWGVGKK